MHQIMLLTAQHWCSSVISEQVRVVLCGNTPQNVVMHTACLGNGDDFDSQPWEAVKVAIEDNVNGSCALVAASASMEPQNSLQRIRSREFAAALMPEIPSFARWRKVVNAKSRGR